MRAPWILALLASLLALWPPLFANEVSSDINSALSSMKGLPEQFAVSFGYCPSDYDYNMEVWNDIPQEINVDVQSIVQVQGAKFNSKTTTSQNIQPYQYAPFTNLNVCHAIIRLKLVGAQSIMGRQVPTKQFFNHPVDISKTDKNKYFYHGYVLDGNYEGEFMGPGWYGGPYTQSTDFEGVFFNNTAYDISLGFTKNTQSFKAILEADSFSLLSSDTMQSNSIRGPNSIFSFILPNNTVKIPISSKGLGQIYHDRTTKKESLVPLTYTYEIVGKDRDSLAIGIQGFNMGNHNQIGVRDVAASEAPAQLAKVRDINPVICKVWNTSPQQYLEELSKNGKPDPSLIPLALPGQLWAAYAVKDYLLQQELPSGAVSSFAILRPPASQKAAQLYLFLVGTDNQAKARTFLSNVIKNPNLVQTIVKTSIKNPATMSTEDIAIAVHKAMQAPTNAIITEPISGITGTLLLTDTFLAYGGGQLTPRFYQISPAILKADATFASIVTAHLAPDAFKGTKQEKSAQATAEFQQNIVGWLATFSANKKTIPLQAITLDNLAPFATKLESLVPDLSAYLRAKGAPTLFNNPNAAPSQRIFSQAGLQALYLILLGPISLSTPPLLMQPGSNVYLAGTPKNWPS